MILAGHHGIAKWKTVFFPEREDNEVSYLQQVQHHQSQWLL